MPNRYQSDDAVIFGIPDNTLLDSLYNELTLRLEILGIINFHHGEISIETFADGEMSVDFKSPVRNKRVYLLCSIHDLRTEKLLTLFINAAKNSNAKKITPVITYFGYARQDKKTQHRGAIGAKVLANNLEAQGINSAIILELHSIATQGLFSVPIDNIPLENILIEPLYIILADHLNPDSIVSVCSPDQGGVARSLRVARLLQKHFPIDVTTPTIIKSRIKPNHVESMILYGDVKGRIVVLVDDMVDTGGTICKAANLLVEKGAIKIIAIFPHAVLSGNSIEKIEQSKIDIIITTDSIPTAKYKLPPEDKKLERIEYTLKNTESHVVSVNRAIALEIVHDCTGASFETVKKLIK